MAKLLAVGTATLDILLPVASYPVEDSKTRAEDRIVCRGGNATNTLVILSQLGHDCAWAGVTVGDADGNRLLGDLAHYGIDTSHSRILKQGAVPTSYVLMNTRTASRTIIHYRDLPEYSCAQFRQIDPSPYDWVHFEGRNISETIRMLEGLREQHPGIRCSVEIEKPRHGIEDLFPFADLLVFSRTYARHAGFQDGGSFLQALSKRRLSADLVCAWGDRGAWGLGVSGESVRSKAFPPPEIVDTRGAGDTFNAGIIDGFLAGQSFPQVLESACRLAGSKCGIMGLSIDGIKRVG